MTDIQVVTRLDEVAQADWDSLVGEDGFYMSYGWLSFVESDMRPGASRYLLARDDGALTGALPLYRLPPQPDSPFAPTRVSGKIGAGDEYLIAGAPRGFRSTLLLAHDGTPRGDARRQGTLTALLEEAASLAARDGCSSVVLPYLSATALDQVARAARVTAAFHLAEAWIEDCGDGLVAFRTPKKRSVRWKITNDQGKFAQAGWQAGERNLGECWRDVARLLVSLEDKYGTTRALSQLEETLSAQASYMADRSVVFTCEDEQGIAGLALQYRWRSTLFARIAGFDYSRLRDAREYFNVVIYPAVEYCARTGLRRIHLGVGSLDAKAYRGATLRPLWTAMLPAGQSPAGQGLRLTLTGDEELAAFADRGFSYDPEEWGAPEKLAAEL